MTNCTTCGQTITEVIIIGNLPYGTTCAERKLGGKLPSNFKGGDLDQFLKKEKINSDQQKADFARRRELTSKAWSEFRELSEMHHRARVQGNDWKESFVRSIISQLGYYTVMADTKFTTMEEAEKGWSPASGTFPYLNEEPRKISSLSTKQQQILNR